MTFAEIILRIGAALGGWLIFFGYALTLAVLPQADCDPANEDLWRGTLIFGAVSFAGLLFAGRGLEWSPLLRWMATPAGLLALYAAYQIAPALTETTLAGESLCGALGRPIVSIGSEPSPAIPVTPGAASSLERAWSVVQLTVLGLGLAQAWRTWQAASARTSAS